MLLAATRHDVLGGKTWIAVSEVPPMMPKLVLVLRPAIILHRSIALLRRIKCLSLRLGRACIHRCLVHRYKIAAKTLSCAQYRVQLIIVLLKILLALGRRDWQLRKILK